jgi:hypothetical protein
LQEFKERSQEPESRNQEVLGVAALVGDPQFVSKE